MNYISRSFWNEYPIKLNCCNKLATYLVDLSLCQKESIDMLFRHLTSEHHKCS